MIDSFSNFLFFRKATISPEYSRGKVSGRATSRSRSLRRLSSMIDLPSSPPSKFKVPSDPARGFININSGGVKRREIEVPPPRVSQRWWGRRIAFLSPPRRIRVCDRVAPTRHPSTKPPPRLPRKSAVRRCHCTALGEGHYSEQGEPVTSAPTPAIDPTPVGRMGVQCTRCALPLFMLTRLVSTLAR